MPATDAEGGQERDLGEGISRVGDVEVGEDLGFQQHWWRFERLAWLLLCVVLVADALGVFGRGWLANARWRSPDGGIEVKYERVERAGTPSMVTVRFSPQAVAGRQVRLYAGEELIQELGAQRIIPQPASSEIGGGGVTYRFPASSLPAEVSIQLEPSFPGLHRLTLAAPGEPPLQARVLVLP
jgi:hypothetical protein